MKFLKKIRFLQLLEDGIRIAVLVLIAMVLIIMGIAIFDKNETGEAPTGSFKATDFNDGWWVYGGDHSDTFSVPKDFNGSEGGEITIVNTLPEDLTDGTSIMLRSSMEDVFVYVDGELRSEYSSHSLGNISYYVPSAYVVTELSAQDAGKEIRIHLIFKTNTVINSIYISHGNNAWFSIIQKGLFVNLSALFIFVLGVFLFVPAIFLDNSFKVGAAKNLGLLMINISLWLISESTLRQLYFHRPSFAVYFSFVLVELMGATTCLYFDEVQHRNYHKRYVIFESIVLFQIIVNIILQAGGIVELYNTMFVSHFLTLACSILSLVNILTDARTKRIREYHFTVLGMIGFIVMSMAELLGFLLNRFHVFGTEVCIGLLMLTGGTIVQTLYDEIKNYNQRAAEYTQMTINTIETIASAIDARDEYTGGHSERVGMYAERLAREMAADYDLSEEDILRIHYIGLVHDIGKIGVADNVLNKPGKLSDEEANLMKKHTEIGYEIMSSLGGGIEGLLDGIRHHHERFDGLGYPDGLSYTDIPLVARILAIADCYDAMTSNRVYRLRLSDEEARNEIERCAGTQFDPTLADIFVRLIDSGEISALTVEGSATDSLGIVRNSALLERRLQDDLFKEMDIVNPTHVRMLCYIMKLMENKGKDYKVVFVTVPDMQETYRAISSENLDAHDINIQYTKDVFVVAFYDKEEQQIRSFLDTVKESCKKIEIEEFNADTYNSPITESAIA
ncbi:HD-GYP domain-containing protein [Butyrivibrio proteoclasticus]|uniref:HD-GYP domain-containing protein n=1 Tax=Butyrivibrio proteoclasticus TaxID=43305 RepID=UPI000479BA45|nr:HD-GYP domain-containing protein [Butyrivibrio proteoclasticus]